MNRDYTTLYSFLRNVSIGGGLVWRLTHCVRSRSCLTPGPVSTQMGDCLQTDKPSQYINIHPRQLSLQSLWAT